VRRIGADADTRGFVQEHALDRDPHEVTFEVALDEIARPWRQLTTDVHAVAVTKLGPQAGGDEVQGVLAQRRAADGVQRALVGAAVFLKPPLQQDGERRLAARGRTQHQQQPPADIGTGGRGLEVVDDTRERLIDTKQLALEQLARAHVLGGVGLRGAPMPAQHVQMYS